MAIMVLFTKIPIDTDYFPLTGEIKTNPKLSEFKVFDTVRTTI